MPLLIRGTGLYGRIDRAGGLFHVATRFWHLYYVPILPLSSWLISFEDGDDSSGWRLPLQVRSILHAYSTSWGGLAALVSAIACAWPVGDKLTPVGEWSWLVRLVLGVGPALLILLSVSLRWRLALPAFLAWVAVTAGTLIASDRLFGEYELYPRCWATVAGCVGLIFLVRRWDNASVKRAMLLAERVGIPAEIVVERLPAAPDGQAEAPARASKGIFGFSGGTSTYKLIGQTRNRSEITRLRAARELASRPEPAPSQALISLLGDPVPSVRTAAREGLLRHGHIAVPPLIGALRFPNESVAVAAAELLGVLDDPQAAEPLAQALAEGTRPVQLAAIAALTELGRASADAVHALTEHEDAWVRRSAQELLAKLGG